jgi:hypothetical protein
MTKLSKQYLWNALNLNHITILILTALSLNRKKNLRFRLLNLLIILPLKKIF